MSDPTMPAALAMILEDEQWERAEPLVGSRGVVFHHWQYEIAEDDWVHLDYNDDDGWQCMIVMTYRELPDVERAVELMREVEAALAQEGTS